MDNRILVVDDEPDFLDSVRRNLIRSGFRKICLERDPKNAAALFEQGPSFDVVLIDVAMPGMDGIALLEIIKRISPDTECIMVTAVDKARLAVEALTKGAYDYLVKPISREALVLDVERALEHKRLLQLIALRQRPERPELDHPLAFAAIVTGSDKMMKVLKEAELHAVSDLPVLITGESGTGKELVARATHAASSRASFPFVPVNMGAISANLFESEFFGHVKGAFTGADRDRSGYLEHADKGTLFLDEIGSLSPDLQAGLLRVLQEKEYARVGVGRPRKADVRFVAASNEDLDALVRRGDFRKDLYYRLKVAWVHVPPLRERKEDIPLLIRAFLNRNGGETCPDISEEATSLLMDYDYPGNVRELKSIVQSAFNLCRGGHISILCLPDYLPKKSASSKRKGRDATGPVLQLSEVEKDHILNVYERMKGNKSRTARALEIGLNTLRRKLESYGVS